MMLRIYGYKLKLTYYCYHVCKAETNEIKETINSINDVIDPIRQEFESDSDGIVLHERNDYLDDLEMVRYKINITIYKIILLLRNNYGSLIRSYPVRLLSNF